MMQELKALEVIYDWCCKQSNTAKWIAVGDFNMRLGYSSEEHDKEVDKIFREFGTGYSPLITYSKEETGTMASWKKDHINDNIIVSDDIKQRFVGWVVQPYEFVELSGTDYSMVRTKDVERLLIPLFTDHWPVATHINLGKKKKEFCRMNRYFVTSFSTLSNIEFIWCHHQIRILGLMYQL
jgi:hypothetical protein